MVEFKRKPLEGVFPLLPLSLKENREVDYDAIRSNVDLLIEQGFHGFIALGSMGSHFAPSEEEFNRVTDVCVDAANDKIVCVVGSTAPNTREAVRRARYAEDAGADGTLLALPYAFPHTPESAARHYHLVNDAVEELAIMVYNDSGLNRGFQMTWDFWDKYLLKMENIKAMKECTVRPAHATLLRIADEVNVFACFEDIWWRLSILGATGIVSQWAWLAPKVILKWYEMCMEGKWSDPWVLKVYKTLQFTGYSSLPVPMRNYVQAILHAMVEIGGGVGGEIPYPYPKLPEIGRKYLEDVAEKLRALE
jgi:dihydrodipicolinate synthase/N-acetylneuraminate lyase